jgi:membrane fusion protein, multidrug efflux system
VSAQERPDLKGAPLLRAQLRAVQSPVISSELDARISRLGVRDGDRFEKGQLLVSFDCTAHQNRLDRARAVLGKKQQVYAINSRLDQLGSTSQLELEVSKAEVAEAKAEVDLGETIMRKCAIHAPFSGRVVELQVHQHQFVREGQALMEILDHRDLEIEMIVPSQWLRWLKPQYPFRIEIDETGRTYDASVLRISGKVDAVSHSVKVYGRIVKPAEELLPGMSGQVRMSPP